ncbi:hypothetical protein UlMin_021953 [Ulmus minor]
MTALHVAASERHSEFVEEIVKLMPAEALEMRDNNGATALHHVVVFGGLKAAKALIKKNPSLTNILDNNGCTPLLVAVGLGAQHKDLVWYLSVETKDEEPSRPFNGPQGGDLAYCLCLGGLNATSTGRFGFCYLHSMASVPSNFFSGSKLGFWESYIYKSPRFLERLQNAKHKHQCAEEVVERFFKKVCLDHGSLLFNLFREKIILGLSAAFGVIEIAKTCLQSCPELAYISLGDGHNLLSISIEHRQEKIFTLFCEKNFRNTQSFIYPTQSGTMLHLVAKSTFPSVIICAVEKFIHPSLIQAQNKDGKTAREIFTEEHKALAEAGEKWMKDTSNSCMIVSTLIATFVFAAAFTVPGGNDDDGNPIFLWTNSFLVFAITDALSLFSSVISLLMFFSIFIASYAEEDFYEKLPRKLIFGLAALFFSITTMMMAFGATLYIVLNERLNWVFIPILLLASLPVTIFALLQFPLFIQMFRSTFGNSIFRPQSPWR